MKESPSDVLISIQSTEEVRTILGPLDTNARLIREVHGVNVLVREGSLRLLGKDEEVVEVRWGVRHAPTVGGERGAEGISEKPSVT